jgi:hypothetical protein
MFGDGSNTTGIAQSVTQYMIVWTTGQEPAGESQTTLMPTSTQANAIHYMRPLRDTSLLGRNFINHAVMYFRPSSHP